MASAFCVYELLVENYGKDLANANRSMPHSERRARNLSSPMFVVWQQYAGIQPPDAYRYRSLTLTHCKDSRRVPERNWTERYRHRVSSSPLPYIWALRGT
jgi:hypothetical protein